MKSKFLFFAIVSLTATLLLAQQPEGKTSPVQIPVWFKAADKDGDGKLSREESPNKDVFGDVDTDADGFASLKEVQVWLAKRPQRNAQPASNKPDSDKTAPPAASSLDDVEKRPVIIFSDGTRMAGDLYLPKNRKPEDKFPAIVLCAGTGGTKGGTQARIAPIFARHGFVVLAFDYRGWGESESQLMAVEPQPKPDANNEMTIKVKALRWQMNSTDQTEDIRAAISFVAGEPNVDKGRIALWGSSYGGGLVTTMAALDSRVKCAAAQVPGMGGRTPRAVSAALDLHTKQARGESEPVPIETGKMTGKMERYSNMRVNPAKNVGFSAIEAAERITTPIIFIVAENEELSNNDNVEAVHKGPGQSHLNLRKIRRECVPGSLHSSPPGVFCRGGFLLTKCRVGAPSAPAYERWKRFRARSRCGSASGPLKKLHRASSASCSRCPSARGCSWRSVSPWAAGW